VFALRHYGHKPNVKIFKPHLEKSISLPEVVIYGLGIIFGAGIYALIAEAVGIAGNSVWISFVIGAFVASFTGLSYCELSSMFPKCAAEYTYVKHAFNSRLIGFMIGWLALFAALFGISAVSIGFGGYFAEIFGTPIALNAICLIAALSIVNFLGIKDSAKLNLLLTGITVFGLVAVIFAGIPFLGSVDYFAHPNPDAGFFSWINSIAVAASLIFFAYIGFEDIANISEETKHAKSVIPKAILVCIIFSTLIYVLFSLSVVSILPWQQLSESTAPVALVAVKAFGPDAFLVFSLIALAATASTVLTLLVAVSRALYGISHDHSMPGIIAKIHSKTKTPYVAIAITSTAAMLFALAGSLEEVAFIAIFGIFSVFLMVNLSAIVLRYVLPEEKRVFRIPGSIGKMPIIPLFGVLSSAFMLSRIDPNAAVYGIIAISLGVPAYFLLAKRDNHNKAGKKQTPEKKAKN